MIWAGTVGDELEVHHFADLLRWNMFGRLQALFPQLQSDIPVTPRGSPVDDIDILTELHIF